MSDHTEQAEAGAPGEGESSSLDHLIARAENIDAGRKPDADPIQVGEVQQSNTADELMGALTVVRSMAAPLMQWWPEFGTTWSDGALQGIAHSGAAVMDKHGWSVGAVLGQWGPYIGLLAAVAPPSFVTYQAIKLRNASTSDGKEAAHVGAQQTAH